jgi:hypothetical protein
VKPPYVAEAAVIGPTARLVRRAEIYEADGVTLWTGAGVESRLTDGNITVDSTRDERRTMDISLDNFDNALVHDPDGGFWYDKIIKMFRGVEVNEPDRPPRVVIVEDVSETSGVLLRSILQNAGFTDVQIRLQFNSPVDLVGYDIVVSLANNSKTAKSALLQSFYNSGGCVFTVGNDSTAVEIPAVIGATVAKTTGVAYTISPIANLAHPLASGWSAAIQGTDTGTIVTAVAAGALAVSSTVLETHTHLGIGAAVNNTGGKWVHLHDPTFGGGVNDFIKTAFTWMNPVETIQYWESQVGEFIIDDISETHFPHITHVVGRDYTAKCMSSKFVVPTAFDPGSSPESIIGALAANSGITKMILPTTGIVTSIQYSFDRNADRWSAMKKIATDFGFELFFDPYGYLIMREFQDPVYAPLEYVLLTGPAGNLVSYKKSTSPSQLYNHILVIGQSSDQNAPVVWAEAINNEPSSPSRVDRIGDRMLEYTSSFITTQEQAQALADAWLKIYSLEEYNLDFAMICVWWLEASEIVQFIDPRRGVGDPDRFLLSSFTIPMGLGPMSGNAKRVTVVG